MNGITGNLVANCYTKLHVQQTSEMKQRQQFSTSDIHGSNILHTNKFGNP
jgi:hypothetical protein